MPIRLNWTRGRNLGLLLMFIGILGLIQVLYIIIAQYAMAVGEQYFVIIIPIGVILALVYSTISVYESGMSLSRYHENRPHSAIQKRLSGLQAKKSWIYLRPIIAVTICFTICFLLSYGFFSTFGTIINQGTIFILTENIGAISCLFYASYKEVAAMRKIR